MDYQFHIIHPLNILKMNRQKIHRFANCEILKELNDVESRGYDSAKTEEEMIRIAIENYCPSVVKNGKKGKWYLRGRGRTEEFLQNRIDENRDKHRDGVYCLLLPDEWMEFGVGIEKVSVNNF